MSIDPLINSDRAERVAYAVLGVFVVLEVAGFVWLAVRIAR